VPVTTPLCSVRLSATFTAALIAIQRPVSDGIVVNVKVTGTAAHGASPSGADTVIVP